MAIEDSCVPAFVVAGAVIVPVATALALAYAIWMQKRVLALDAAWRVALCDLSFDEPVVVLGRGSYGTVLRGRVGRTRAGRGTFAGMWAPCGVTQEFHTGACVWGQGAGAEQMVSRRAVGAALPPPSPPSLSLKHKRALLGAHAPLEPLTAPRA